MGNGITKREEKKMFIYMVMVVLGFMFGTSIKEIWLNDLMEQFTPVGLLVGSVIGLLILYYYLDMDK